MKCFGDTDGELNPPTARTFPPAPYGQGRGFLAGWDGRKTVQNGKGGEMEMQAVPVEQIQDFIAMLRKWEERYRKRADEYERKAVLAESEENLNNAQAYRWMTWEKHQLARLTAVIANKLDMMLRNALDG